MPLVALLIFTLAETGVPAPVQVTYATSPAPLRGFLYRPAGPGPFPALVFNHGSERDASDLRGQAVFYVPRGFVVFVPHRRGHGLSGGEYYDDVWKRSGRQPAKLVELLDAQVDDVAAAVAWVGRLAYVDRTRVVLAGCSFGGIETLLAAERGLGLRAALDFAGGAILWARTPPLQERMKRAARLVLPQGLRVLALQRARCPRDRALPDRLPLEPAAPLAKAQHALAHLLRQRVRPGRAAPAVETPKARPPRGGSAPSV
jgi:dienelactone hydrolase